MNTIILFISPEKWSVEKWCRSRGGYRSDKGLYVLESGNEWLSLIEQEDIFNDYDLDEIKEVESLISSPLSYVVEWRGENLFSILINDVDCSSVIDNDHGLICYISKIKDKKISEWINKKSI